MDDVDGALAVVSNNAPATFSLGGDFNATDTAGNTGTAQATANVTYTALPVDAVPPVRSSGALGMGTTSTIISSTTNEKATCKYDTTSQGYVPRNPPRFSRGLEGHHGRVPAH